MSNFGTCKHAYQIQEQWVIPVGAQPHQKEVHEVLPEEYLCQWLDTVGPLPPPVARKHGALVINRDECDKCPRYEPAGGEMPFLMREAKP